MLRNRDIELIAALVEGKLEDESEARALIAGSDEARAEYEAQRLAYEALTSAQPVELTEHERSALRRDIWTALQTGPTPGPKKAPWYYRWAPVAAGLLVVVGLVSVLNQGGAGDSADVAETFSEISGGLATDTTQAAADTLEPTADDGGARMDSNDASEESTAPMTSSSSEFFEQTAEQIRSGELEGLATFSRDETDGEGTDPATCLDASGLESHQIIGEVSDDEASDEFGSSRDYLVAVPVEGEIGPDTPVAFVDAASCEIAYVDR